jgi:pimeloyl-ACP methyl ester carboxylesterase
VSGGEIILVHGLWMPRLAMTLLAARLAREGYRVHTFAYRGRAPLASNIERLTRFVRERVDGRPAHFVGHSLGGVLVYDTLSRHPNLASGHVVLLGAPVRGCHAGRRLGAAALGRWLLGACRERWQEHEARWARHEPLGVIAGTLPVGLGRLLGTLRGDNDGVVRVAETEIEGMSDRALVREPHSLLTVSPRVAALTAHFLRAGRFA